MFHCLLREHHHPVFSFIFYVFLIVCVHKMYTNTTFHFHYTNFCVFYFYQHRILLPYFMKKLLFPILSPILALVLLSSPVTVLLADDAIGDLTIGRAVNIAARQRMFSQRMAKAFALSTQQIDVDLNDEQLMGCISTFDANQAKLAEYAPTLELKNKISKVSGLWADYKLALQKDRNKLGLMDVMENNQAMFLACDDVVRSLNDYAAAQPDFNPAFKLGKGRNMVDAAARVRSLSQRMTYYSVVLKSGMQFAQTKEYLEVAHTEFRANLGNIMLFSENSPEATAEIAEIVGIWEKYNNAAKMLGGEYDLIQMNEDFNKVVSLVDHVVLEYEEALDTAGQVSKN